MDTDPPSKPRRKGVKSEGDDAAARASHVRAAPLGRRLRLGDQGGPAVHDVAIVLLSGLDGVGAGTGSRVPALQPRGVRGGMRPEEYHRRRRSSRPAARGPSSRRDPCRRAPCHYRRASCRRRRRAG